MCPAHVRRPLHGGRGVGVHGVHLLAKANSVKNTAHEAHAVWFVVFFIVVVGLIVLVATIVVIRVVVLVDRVMHKFRAKSRL